MLVHLHHPLIEHHLARLRSRETGPEEFRRTVHRLTTLLAFEATRDLVTEPIDVQTPLACTRGQVVRRRIGLAPILRAGLGMVDPLLELMPMAEVWHLGVFRNEETAQPVEYYNRIPPHYPVDVAFLLDPMLATGGSACAALRTLQKWGVPCRKVMALIAAPEGLAVLAEADPDAQVYVCAVDAELNSRKFIVPGLGDAGDRQFNTQA